MGTIMLCGKCNANLREIGNPTDVDRHLRLCWLLAEVRRETFTPHVPGEPRYRGMASERRKPPEGGDAILRKILDRGRL